MAKQKVGKTYKTSKFSSTKGFDRNQPTLSRIVNRLNDAVRNTGPVVENVNVTIQEQSEDLVQEPVNVLNEDLVEDLVEDPVENSVEEEMNDVLPENSVLTEYFENLQIRLTNEGYPSEYNNGTFWIEPMMTFFALQSKKEINYLYRPRVFLWIPHLLLNKGLGRLRCTKNNCNKKLETKGYNKKPHARRIVDICCDSKCGASYNAHDPEIIEQLPLELQVEFPAVLSHRGGISKVIADLLRPCIQNSVGPERFQKILPIIEVLQPKMDKHMMLLDGKILKGDHSFKFPKHMAKIEDTSVFTGLYTMTNEYEEIVHQVLVPSKALSYLKHSFQKMSKAYTDYGHEMPIAFYTDNVKGDQTFVEGIFESLKEGVKPTSVDEMNSNGSNGCNYLQLPDAVEVSYICRDFDLMESSVKYLHEEIESSVRINGEAAIGLDCEWDISHSQGVDICKVDVVQLAFKKKVYVLHIDRCWTSLPTSLVSILENESVKKVGRQVGGDLSRLSRGLNVSCRGKIELGSFCSSRKIIPNGTLSLSGIALRVLGQGIKKDERESHWSSMALTSEQIAYAALDAWASLAIFEAVKKVPEAGSRTTSKNCVPGVFVDLKPRGLKHVIASGRIEQPENNSSAEKNSCRLRILKVNVPGYMVKQDNGIALPAIERRDVPTLVPLSSFTEPEFVITVFKADLMTATNSEVQNTQSERQNSSAIQGVLRSQSRINPSTTASNSATSEADIDIAFTRMFKDNATSVNKNTFKHGYVLFTSSLNIDNEITSESSNDDRIYSRVVKDAFHLMDMIKPYKQHGLYKEFMQRFSDSLFVLDEADKALVTKALQDNNETWEMKMKYDRKWLWERVKRKISSPNVLLPVLQSLFLSFGPLKCSKSGRVLFDKVSWSQALSVLKTVQLGHVSDPPGVQLYYQKGKKDKKFGSFGAGPELASAMLVEYRLRHNFDVGTFNRFGVEYKGHYDPWLTQHLDFLRQSMDMPYLSIDRHIAIEVNALRFRSSQEVFDGQEFDIENDNTIPKMKNTVFLKIGSTLREKNCRYHYVATRQKTKYAVIAVHTLEEKLLFGRMINEAMHSSSRVNPNFDQLSKAWNLLCNGDKIFYKTPEHLEKHYKHWKEQQVARNTREIHYSVMTNIQLQIQQKNSTSSHLPFVIPSLPNICNNQNVLTAPTMPIQLPATEIPLPEKNTPAIYPSSISSNVTNYYYRISPQHTTASFIYNNNNLPQIQSRTADYNRSNAVAQTYHPYSKEPPTLKKSCKGCGVVLCNGKMKRSNCKNPICLNCKRKDCEGVWDRKKCQSPASIN
ncbi:uncharacterized protein EV154DRAFT_606504 [Mucor mucedo]|uniref:uncharacterized protein n=1 Tax=Mucor mucedo TaxID=29922 RepID=UPI00222124B8|nr:uncharacterized protein EV154DRAFT_606504 [Mucor mucedo]KAI7878129.1 hypothetical protein EV154DRAFT_606504 [Mucor mucedo]